MRIYAEMNNAQLVTTAVKLDQSQKEYKSKLDAVKAELQGRGLRIIEDRNVKFIKFFSSDGNVSVMDSQQIDVLNPDKLKKLLSEGVWEAKVKETTETKYKYDSRLEQMLKAIFTGDYTFEYTLESFLDEMSIKPDAKQKKLLIKKLKGDYVKDKQTLVSVFGYPNEDAAPDFDVELYYIYKIKNGELIKAFLPEDGLDQTIEAIKKCLIVDSKTSITIDYSCYEYSLLIEANELVGEYISEIALVDEENDIVAIATFMAKGKDTMEDTFSIQDLY